MGDIFDPVFISDFTNTLIFEGAVPYCNKLNQALQDYRNDLRTIIKTFPVVTVINHKLLLPMNPDLYTDGVQMNEEGQKWQAKI